MTDLVVNDAVASVCAEALRHTISRYGLERVLPGLTSGEDVTWANGVAFLSVVVEPLDPFSLYVGRLVGGALPEFVPDGGPWHFLDVDFFFEDAGVAAPDRGPMAPGLHELVDALRRYDAVLPQAVGQVLEGELETFERVVALAKSRAFEETDEN